MQNALAFVAAGVVRAIERRSSAGISDGISDGSSDGGSDGGAAGPDTAIAAALRADYGHLAAFDDDAASGPEREEDRLLGLGEVLGLGGRDLAVLAIAAAADLDANLALAFGALIGRGAPSAPTIGLVLELIGAPSVSGESYDLVGAQAPLRARDLVTVEGSGPWLTRTLRVPDRVVAYLVEADEWDPTVRAIARAASPRTDPVAEQVARALGAGAGLVWVHSPLGTAGLASAAGALGALGIGALCLDVSRPAGGVPLVDVLRAGCLDAALRGIGLLVTGLETLTDPAAGAPACVAVLWDAAVPVVGVARTGFDASWIDRPVPVFRASALTPDERAQAWGEALGPDLADPAASDLLGGLRLAPEDIASVAALARLQTASRQEPVTVDAVRAAARELGSGRDGAPPPSSQARLQDLVLPDHLLADVRRLISWAMHRDEVLARGSIHGKGGKGTGIAALFTGSPGTGKTLSAHVIADELGVELMQVDLSSVIDKYIGETEKNLERIFHQAESRNVVLFFDEADALFGSRSAVNDSRDRYANQEVSYLLQRMERFDGITLLATNLRGNLDQAFTRRLQFVLHFPDPDQATRERLWRHHLAQTGAQDPADAVDVEVLARSVELAGGDIRNIVLGATYDAVGDGGLLGMRHVRAAAVREYTKLGRRAPGAVSG